MVSSTKKKCSCCGEAKEIIEEKVKLYEIFIGEEEKSYWMRVYCPECNDVIRIELCFKPLTTEELDRLKKRN